MIKVTHGSVWFKPEIKNRVLELIRFQCSAKRSAYQAVVKYHLKGNEIKKYVKKNYMKNLNQRYIADACSSAMLFTVNKGVCFGGKKNWQNLITDNLSKEDWQTIRNCQLFSRGDATHTGNPNIRILKDKIYINDPSGSGKWIEGKVFIPVKFNIDFSRYSVRLLYKNDKFRIIVSWQEQEIELPVQKGAVGVDCNPDGVAVVETNITGDLLYHHYIKKQRIQFASENKRDYDVRLLTKEVVQFADAKQKPIVIEKLSFKQGKKYTKKFTRMRSNFLYRKILNAIKARALKTGVPVVEVEPAFTSMLGRLKYQKMYSLNRHTAAALVIARRGMGIQERQSFTVKPSKTKKEYLNLEGRGYSIALSSKAFSWLEYFLKSKPSSLTGSVLAIGRPIIGTSVGVTPTGESFSKTSREGTRNCSVDERLPSELDKVVQIQ